MFFGPDDDDRDEAVFQSLSPWVKGKIVEGQDRAADAKAEAARRAEMKKRPVSEQLEDDINF